MADENYSRKVEDSQALYSSLTNIFITIPWFSYSSIVLVLAIYFVLFFILFYYAVNFSLVFLY